MKSPNDQTARPSRRRNARDLIVFGAFVASVLALIVPLNMGGCGASDVGSTITSFVPGGGGIANVPSIPKSGGPVSVSDAVKGGVQGVQAVSIDDTREANLGRNVALQITTRYGVIHDKRIERYVTLVGLTVADASPRTDYPYCFAVLNTDKVNAFSGPCGFVMITRGALAQMRDESELAGVLGHEIGHINKQHGKAAASRAGVAGALGTAFKNTIGQFGKLSDVCTNAVLNGFSEPEENDADAEGVRYAAAAGYNPEGYLHFLQRMAAAQGGQAAPFASHPGLADRVTRVADQISREHLGGKGQTLHERFAANVRLNEPANP